MKNFTGTEFVNNAARVDEPTQLSHDDKQLGQWESPNMVWSKFTPTQRPDSEEYFKRTLWLG